MAAADRMGHSNASVTTRHHARMIEGRDAEIADSLDADHREASDLAAQPVQESPDTGPPEVAQEWHKAYGCETAAVA
jgi:hypothetical protein